MINIKGLLEPNKQENWFDKVVVIIASDIFGLSYANGRSRDQSVGINCTVEADFGPDFPILRKKNTGRMSNTPHVCLTSLTPYIYLKII